MVTKRIVICLTLLISMLSSWAIAQKMTFKVPPKTQNISDQEVVDAYQYYLGRLLVLRQQNSDFSEGFKWNTFVHRDPGKVEWANPNLDVVYSEAWIAMDKNSCTMLEIPSIKGRYYTIQTLNGWGETTSNINERTYKHHPAGRFAYCLPNSTVPLAGSVQRITLPANTARILARIEIGRDLADTQNLQKQMKLSTTGTPTLPEIIKIEPFSNSSLPGIAAFDNATVVLNSEHDINPGMKPMESKVRAIEAAAKTSQRESLDQVIKSKAIPIFISSLSTMGEKKNGWTRPTHIGNYGSNYKDRSLVNFAGIWANNMNEVIYFKTNLDGQNRLLNGAQVYTLTFPPGDLPDEMSQYFWSVIAVDSKDFRVVENPMKKYLLNNQTGVQKNPDGSLTLTFASRKPTNTPENNWLPTPNGVNYHLTMRYYGPSSRLTKGGFFPPPLIMQSGQLARSP